MISSAAKNSCNRDFADCRDLKKKKRFGKSGLILLQSLDLYLAIIYSWQLSSSCN